MDLRELKKIEPAAELYELRDDARYMLVLPLHTSPATLERLRDALRHARLTQIAVVAGEIRIFEFWDTRPA